MKSPVKYIWVHSIWLVAAAVIACFAWAARGVGNKAGGPAAFTAFSSAPLYFETNAGQSEVNAPFIARGSDCSVVLSPDAAEITVGETSDETVVPHQQKQPRTVRLQLVGANPAARMAGLDRMAGTANYFIGNDPSKWHAGVPLFSRVQADDVYPGVQMIYYASQSAQLEYDFLLQAGGRPDKIHFRVEGADDVEVDASGNLVLKIGGEEISQDQPVAYQVVNGARHQIDVAYRLNQDGTVGFALGHYDSNLPLTIDPVLEFLTYLGGKNISIGWDIELDGSNIYVAGETLSKNLATTNPIVYTNSAGVATNFGIFQGGTGAFGDAFVASYGTNGSLNYLSYLGGRRDDGALAIAGDGSGGVWLTGFTDSTNFPLVNPIRSQLTGPTNNALRIHPADAFITHVGASGSILFSTYFGGEEIDEGTGITLDGGGNVYVTGLTSSSNLLEWAGPTNIPEVFQPTNAGFFDAFIVELSPAAAPNTYSNTFTTYFGGTNTDYALGIALDSTANIWITGLTFSTNFVTTNLFPLTNQFLAQMSNHTANSIETNHLFTDLNSQTNSRNHDTSFHSDAFVSEFSPYGTNLLFSTLLGGSNDDAGVHMVIDSSNDVYVAGYTLSVDYPTNVATGLIFESVPNNTIATNVFPNATSNFISHAFVTELSLTVATNDSGVVVTNYAISASTSLGGDGADRATGIALDGSNNVYVIGSAGSTNFFQTNVVILTTNFLSSIRTNHNGRITNIVGIATNNFTFTNMTSTNFLGRFKLGANNTNDIFIVELTPGLTNYVQSIILGGPGDNEPTGIAVETNGNANAVYFTGSTTSKTNLATTNAVVRVFTPGSKLDAIVGKISGLQPPPGGP